MLQDKVITRIRKKRDELSYSQAYVAELLDMSPQNYQQIEAGATKLTLERIEQIAAIFKIEPLELMADSINYTNNMNGKFEGTNNIGAINHIENFLRAEKDNEETILFYRHRIENLEQQITTLLNKLR